MATAKITNESMVECKNGTHGNLFYASTRNPGYTVEWTEFGEVQEMDYAELLVMRGSQPRFFRDNWILIEDANVLRKLGVERYYKNALTTENFDEVFKWTPDEIREKVPKMSEGMRDSIRIRAKEMLKADQLDSRAMIKALNDVLDCDLEESVALEAPKKPRTRKSGVEIVTIGGTEE